MRHVEAHKLLRHDQRRDHCGKAQDEEYVEDIAADHVADGDIDLPR
jgi:hypothetical protein